MISIGLTNEGKMVDLAAKIRHFPLQDITISD